MQSKKPNLADDNLLRLLTQMSLPAIVAMSVNALYNVVDAAFVGRGVGTLGLAGVSLVFPLQMAYLALSQFFGIGGGALISIALGERDREKASRVMGNVWFSFFLMAPLLTGAGFLFKSEIITLFGATGDVVPFTDDYLSVILGGTVFTVFSMIMNNILRAQGFAREAMISMLIGVVSNIILDPIFIFGFDMGTAGAAWATIIARFFSAFYILLIYFKPRFQLVRPEARDMLPRLKPLFRIMSVGLSSLFRQSAASILLIVVNNILVRMGSETDVAAFAVINRTMMLVLMPVFGLAQGLQPIIGFNYGARRLDKVLKSVTLALFIATGVTSMGFVLGEFFPRTLLSLFSSDESFVTNTAVYMRLFTAMFPLVGFQVIISTLYQAMGHVRPAVFISLLRQIIILIPLLFLLPSVWGLSGVWVSFPLADILSFLVIYGMFAYFRCRIRGKLSYGLA
ncbi:MAG TPA: MATE family efflux transporter [Candidatus Mcinerneyibacteriales bacterium]|nr:MATE family efflux transporter [Candidatus Mcinerneyibacteriales bacterium]HPJ69871.1 MATE family efflux transporter [Candidatus Mcinerneyibacteriales bacterium]HPQ89413.1 MATE family efflux transporter [Candidatus Mcinerneyibacteriales bacterium]